MAQQTDMTQDDIARNVLLSLSSSAVVLPNFWINPRNQISYLLVLQTPQYQVTSVADVQRLPLTGGSRGDQMLMNIAEVKRTEVPMLISESNILPVFDVNADVEGRDLASAAAEINKVLDADRPPEESGIKVTLAGQVQTMRAGFAGIAGGMALAIVLVYLLMVINFQSWLDPLIVLMAVPCTLAGVAWFLYLTHTHLSVPALMGTLMCIGLPPPTASWWWSSPASGWRPATTRHGGGRRGLYAHPPGPHDRRRHDPGDDPDGLGVGEGGEQNAPLARAVIGGLLFATFATLVFVPSVFRLVHRAPPTVPPGEGGGR